VIDPDLDSAINEALQRAGEFAQLGWSGEGRRISLSEEAETLSKVPPVPMLAKLSTDLEAALAREPDDRINRILIGLMMDAFPNARAAQPGTYADALAHDLRSGGFPPFAVAEGLRAVRRSSVFLPAISEVLTAVQDAVKQRRGRAQALRLYADRRTAWTRSLSERMARAAATETSHRPNPQNTETTPHE
jgi:hypothetical protein